MSTKQQKIAQLVVNNQKNQAKIIEKVITDLEDLCKKLVEQFQNENQIITNDSFELQKFCSKLEFLLQFKLKEKKSLLSSNNASNKDYWSVFVNLLKDVRTFEDAIKYVKNLNEIKTNIGRGRAFIRFCLQYHRLADAIQQITLDDRFLSNWYSENSVWLNTNQKSRIIQILYDLNDINFDIITKSNYELDTSWPTIMSTNNNNNNSNVSINHNRTRTLSITSYSSTTTENIENLLSSTPLEMDDDVFSKLLNKTTSPSHDYDSYSANTSKKVSPTSLLLTNSLYSTPTGAATGGGGGDTTSHYEFDLYDQKLKEYEIKIHELELQLNENKNETKELNELKHENKYLLDEIMSLNKKINDVEEKLEEKTSVYNNNNVTVNNNNDESVLEINVVDLDKNKVKFEEMQSELDDFKEKYSKIEVDYLTISDELNQSKIENDVLKKEINSLKFELSAKILNEENLIKDAVSQTRNLDTLKDMCLQQEITINKMRDSLDLLKNNRETEMDMHLNEIKLLRQTLESKENESTLLIDQIAKLTKSLEEEKKFSKSLLNENTEFKKTYEIENEQKNSLISQLEMDNNEIKKRLVKLIKEKAELWQKADNLEYENLLKSTAMWQDDASIHNCMSCNSQFSFLLRKHHCRVCLKIYCYYCCNSWIEYNNSKVRVCKKCHENQENLFKFQALGGENVVHNIEQDDNHQQQTHSIISQNKSIIVENGDDDDEDDDPDINFEVRPEKLPCPFDEDTIATMPSPNNNNNNSNNTNSTASTHLDSKKEAEFFIPENAIDDLDTFTIVSNDEIEKLIKKG